MFVCVCVYVGNAKAGHIPYGDTLRLISNALYERELSPLSDLSTSRLSAPSSRPLSSLYTSFSFLSELLTPPAHSLYFIHLACCIFLSGFYFELIQPPPPLSVQVHRIHDEIEILAFWLKQMPRLLHQIKLLDVVVRFERLEDKLIR